MALSTEQTWPWSEFTGRRKGGRNMVKTEADSVPRRALWRGVPARAEVVKCRAGQMEGSQCVSMRELLKGPVWAGRGQGQGRGGSPAVGGRLVPQPQGFLARIVFAGFERICLPLPILLPLPPQRMAVQTSQHRPVPASGHTCTQLASGRRGACGSAVQDRGRPACGGTRPSRHRSGWVPRRTGRSAVEVGGGGAGKGAGGDNSRRK